jgi:ubiquinone/menaquinone biosynthesis C-methylase UbiE
MLVLLLVKYSFSSLSIAAGILIALIAVTVLISLSVSFYIYDLSGLYKLSWLDNMRHAEKETIINIHAGFDETSRLLQQKFSTAHLQVADFYDPAKHTEVSIKRARKAYSAFPETQAVNTEHLPMPTGSADKVFTIFSAHEIRNAQERIDFFKEIGRILKPSGQIIVTEHLRNTANFLAYNFGFFHFYSKASWLRTFRLAGLTISKQIKITPFITTFILEKNGTAS